MGMTPNSRISAEIAGIVSPVDFAGMATNKARVQYIRDLLAAETVDGADLLARQYLDEMHPNARRSLIVMLDKCIAAVTNA